MNAPQVIMIIWLRLGILGSKLYDGKEVRVDFWQRLFITIGLVYLLIWGKFF